MGEIIYNLYFHPLAKFPGPRINAASPLPGIIALLKGRLPLDNKKLHDKYGSVVRVSPNELAFNSVQAWEDIYGTITDTYGLSVRYLLTLPPIALKVTVQDTSICTKIRYTLARLVTCVPKCPVRYALTLPSMVLQVEPLQGVTTLTMADDDNHARQRRALSHSFSQKALLEQEYIVQRYVDQFIANLKRMAEKDEEFNMVNWYVAHPSVVRRDQL